jgi:hypothetical protein
MKNLFSAVAGGLLCLLSATSFAQTKITAYEYWIDGNYSAKVAGTISPVVNASINFTANTAAIHSGYHTLSYWVKDNNGKWSSVITKGFTNSHNNMSKFEYWFDGNYSTAVQVSVPNTFNATYTNPISVASVSVGTHAIAYHFKDMLGGWSVPITDSFNRPDSSTSVVSLFSTPATIYPNPTTGDIFVALPQGNYQYSIYDAVGKIVQEGTVVNNQIRLQKLATGIYLLLLTDQATNKRYHQKIIKE